MNATKKPAKEGAGRNGREVNQLKGRVLNKNLDGQGKRKRKNKK